MNIRSAIVVGLCGVIALGLYFGLSGHFSKSNTPALDTDAATASVRPEPASKGAGHRPRVALDKQDERRGAFETADDLSEFIRSLDSAVDANDPEAIWLVSRAIDYCLPYASNPSGFSNDTNVLVAAADRDLSSPLKAAREKVSSRCRNFNSTNPLSRSDALVNIVRAAKAGSLPAEAALVTRGTPLDKSDDYLRDLVRRVEASGDPEAFLAISEAMGPSASARGEVLGPASGTVESTFAWQLAACRSGLDCSSGGSLMTMYCSNGGICGPYDSFEELLFQGLVPQNRRTAINTLVDTIILQGEGKL